jgi:Tfp pilus assembly protein PilO
MKQLITALILVATAAAAHAGTYETAFEQCISTRAKGTNPELNQKFCAGDAERAVKIESLKAEVVSGQEKFNQMLLASNEKLLAKAQSEGKTCAIRRDAYAAGDSVVVCRDAVGAYQYK